MDRKTCHEMVRKQPAAGVSDGHRTHWALLLLGLINARWLHDEHTNGYLVEFTNEWRCSQGKYTRNKAGRVKNLMEFMEEHRKVVLEKWNHIAQEVKSHGLHSHMLQSKSKGSLCKQTVQVPGPRAHVSTPVYKCWNRNITTLLHIYGSPIFFTLKYKQKNYMHLKSHKNDPLQKKLFDGYLQHLALIRSTLNDVWWQE